ncbi:MBL fold metallo-hydrolase [Flavobacterium sp. ANB]|uniref:MBL fold metallo-hydrolase n=1 Tax=unclassified Flavobacterium TaxID=196869 RepID=UPI0012B8A802|nr:MULTISPECIES: MBL fold metallo-hydrolase [unclassified Flavobacterium]MBF4515459.1 MBL fold metallo-hydrolase [Flavobacterium sp. ANB]MTD68462.1 MBL fold metallo-hydrolase [Flavobacterium sp. LC2016-13]
MKKTIYTNNLRMFSLLLFLLVLTFPLSILAQNKTDGKKPQIFHIQNYFSEAYLVKGNSEKLILIETGVSVPGYQDSLVNSIRKLGFKPENISLAIVTHGHGDHAGNARFLQQTFKIKIAGSKFDLDKFTSGKTELSKSEDVSIWGTRLRPYTDLSYTPFTPDIIVENNTIDLEKYGVNGKIIPIKGGHTSGDLLILIGENLFVGDAFLGTFKAQGGGLIPDGHHVREHFYHENKKLADENLKVIEKIAIENKIKTVYPTHNGPVTTYELTKYIKEEPLLRLLSKQESNLAAEDFRIVYANENTAVMTFLETSKADGKDAKTASVTETYSKEKGIWKLVYKQVN